MKQPVFTQEQISFLADKIINKLVLPMHVLEDAMKEGIVYKKFLKDAHRQLSSLVEWIREIGG